MTGELVTHFSSESEAYRESFDTFLRSTDLKVKTRAWLEGLVKRLPRRRVFIDAGAGEGTTTAWVAEHFQRTLAIEPNESLRRRLTRSCPDARTLPQDILSARPDAEADLVLCSHLFYHLDDDAWDENLEQLASWKSGDAECMNRLIRLRKPSRRPIRGPLRDAGSGVVFGQQ